MPLPRATSEPTPSVGWPRLPIVCRNRASPLITRNDLRLQPVLFDLYRDIHKAIRSELFAVTTQAARCDPSDVAVRGALSARVRSIAELLDTHASHEDTVIQPALELHYPDFAELVEHDHKLLERRIYGLVSLAVIGLARSVLAPADFEAVADRLEP